MNSRIVNSVICISESQKNPKRYENLSMCKQYAKEAGCNVKMCSNSSMMILNNP